MRKVLITLFILVIGLSLISCNEKHYEEIQQSQTQQLMDEAIRQIGLPNIKNFWQRKLLKMIYEIADQSDIITYAYTFNQFTGKFRYIGRAIGFGVPFSAQYTNPDQVVETYRGSVVIKQPDPNGLYMPTSSSATWIILIDENTGDLNLMYIEPLLTVTQRPLPDRIVEGYPKDFWKKYYNGEYRINKDQIHKKVEELKRSIVNNTNSGYGGIK